MQLNKNKTLYLTNIESLVLLPILFIAVLIIVSFVFLPLYIHAFIFVPAVFFLFVHFIRKAIVYKLIAFEKVSKNQIMLFLLLFFSIFLYIFFLSSSAPFTSSYSVDTVHHSQLIESLLQNNQRKADLELFSKIGEMALYPPGAHVIAAYASQIFKINSFLLLHFEITMSTTLQLLLVFLITLELLKKPNIKLFLPFLL